MAPCDGILPPGAPESHRPRGEAVADALTEAWRDMTVADIAGAVGISQTLARSMKLMIHRFHDKSRGARAIEAYTGVVFRAFGYQTLDDGARAETSRQVRIISSLYGCLRPDDTVRPYRLDFTTVMTPPGLQMAAFWRDRVTRMLLDDIAAEGSGEVLDLMPAAAARSVDMKRLAEAARVWKADFRQPDGAGAMRTPAANRLKTLRGQLLRHIVSRSITSARALESAETDTFYADSVTDGVISLIAE